MVYLAKAIGSRNRAAWLLPAGIGSILKKTKVSGLKHCTQCNLICLQKTICIVQVTARENVCEGDGLLSVK